MKETPLISVITPAYNAAAYLPALIESVLAQDYPYVEHLIIDDGSTDETAQVLARYSHLRWWTRANKGQYATQNEAISQAKGDIVVVIAADDVFLTPDAFSRVVNYWRQHPECGLVYGRVAHMDESGTPLPALELNLPPLHWFLRQWCYVHHCSLFLTRDLALETPFDPTLRYTGDWDWLLRLFEKHRRIGHIPSALAVRRLHTQQTSQTAKLQAIQAETRAVCEKYGGSYPLHRCIGWAMAWRARVLLGMDLMRKRGIGGVYRRMRRQSARE